MPRSFAIIFDMDGVIVDSNPFHKISLRQFVSKYGYELSESQLREKIYGRTNKDWITNLFGDLPATRIRELADEKEQLFRDLYQNDIQLLPGLLNFLKLIEQYQIPKAIATSAPLANVDFTLEKTHTKQFFQTILHDTHISQGKPHPEIYLKTAAALNQSPANCLVFEDSLSGIASAKAAGCRVVGITTTHTPEELHEAHYIIRDFIDQDPKDLFEKVR